MRGDWVYVSRVRGVDSAGLCAPLLKGVDGEATDDALVDVEALLDCASFLRYDIA